MPRLPRVTAREAERAILKDGWLYHHNRGSHRYYTHPTKAGQVCIAHHAGQIIPRGTTSEIIKQAGLTVDQFRTLL